MAILGRAVSRFDRGVGYYTVAMVPIHFPENCVSCRYCPLMKFQLVNSAAAIVCRSTGEIITDIDNPGDKCPAVIQEDNNEHL